MTSWGRHGRARVARALFVSVLLLGLLVDTGGPGRARSAPPPENSSPPGQIQVLTVNARQMEILDLATFRRIFELVRALRNRPTAFDGGVRAATAMPDMILFQEMRFSNLEIIRKLMQQRSGFEWGIVSAEGAMSRFLVNMSTMTPVSEPQTIQDPCRDGSDGLPPKQYQFARFTETTTGAPVTFVGVHLKAKYFETGQDRCRERNMEAIKSAVAGETGPVIIGGDFNARPVTIKRECDLDEQSAPLEWWTMLTAPADGSRQFLDAVTTHHRAVGESMTNEWTFERFNQVLRCDNTPGLKRTRLDYLFAAGALIAEAHADHPGWAGVEPGTTNAANYKYSDHRWVSGRFVILGPPQPLAPVTVAGADGVVDVTWQPQEGVHLWTLYRATGSGPYRRLVTVPSEVTSYHDTKTVHGNRYRYAVAPVGEDRGQGLESPDATVVADARGPRVIAKIPHDRASGVPRRTKIDVFFDEPIDLEAVVDSTIRVLRDGRVVRGALRSESRRHLVFDPFVPLRDDTRYRVIVGSTKDELGNSGARHYFSFST